MYTSLSIKNFRAFETLEIEGLKRVNLFTGRNNSGKTSVLEAVYLCWGSNDAPRVARLFEARGLASNRIDRFSQRTMPWATLFHDLEVEADIEIVGINENGGDSRLEISTILTESDRTALDVFETDAVDVLVTRKLHLVPRPRDFLLVKGKTIDYPLRAISFAPRILFAGAKPDPRELAEYYNSLELDKSQKPILDSLKIIDARISDLKTNFSDGYAVMYADVGRRRLLPLSVLGDGAGRLFQLALEMRRGEGSVVLIDEIENGFHYSVLPKVWKLIHELAKQYNVQVFAVTHSHECAVAAHEAASAADYDYGYFRIEQKDGIGRAVAYSHEQMQTSIEANLEVR